MTLSNNNYGLFSLISFLLCIACAVHTAVYFGTFSLSFIFLLISSYFVFEIVKNERINSPIVASLAAAGCLSARYLFYVVTGDMNNSFLIGDSDSLLYNNVSEIISITFSLSHQLTSIDHVQIAADQLGYLIPNRGMYWVLGVLYTLVGFESGPASFFIINVISAITISYFSLLIANYVSENDVDSNYAVLFSLLIFSITQISDHGLHLRKDFILVALFTSGIYFSLKRNYIIAGVLLGLSLELRMAFLPVYLVVVFSNIALGYESFKNYFKSKNCLYLLLFLIVIISIDVGGIFKAIGMSSLESNTNVLETLYVDFKGSAVFASSIFLQWVYIILYPFPPLSPNAYSDFVAWDSLVTFLINMYLFYNFYQAVVVNKGNEKLVVVLLSWCTLFGLLLINLVSASAIGTFGVVEPRYKFAIWVVSGIIMLCNFTNKVEKL